MPASFAQQLADAKLGGEGRTVEFIRSRRPHTSWRKIARALESETGLDLTYETVRSWAPDSVEKAS